MDERLQKRPAKVKESAKVTPSDEQYRKIAKLWHIGGITPSAAELGFNWPAIDVIRGEQKKSPGTKTGLQYGQDGLYRKGSCIWIPSEATELKLRILVISHGGIGGHRGIKATESILREYFYWTSMCQDVVDFV